MCRGCLSHSNGRSLSGCNAVSRRRSRGVESRHSVARTPLSLLVMRSTRQGTEGRARAGVKKDGLINQGLTTGTGDPPFYHMPPRCPWANGPRQGTEARDFAVLTKEYIHNQGLTARAVVAVLHAPGEEEPSRD